MTTKPISIGQHMRAVDRASEGWAGWTVTTNDGGSLGTIEFNGKWRQWEFCPATGAAFTFDCLYAMSQFLSEQNTLRKQSNAKEKP